MSHRVLIVSGPNLGLLGSRQPDIYGSQSLDAIIRAAVDEGRRLDLAVDHVQSDSEAELLSAVHRARHDTDALVVNAGALSHTSWSLHDAIAAYHGVTIELHLSNPAAREPFRHTSVLAPVVDGSIAGFGAHGYGLALLAVARLLQVQDSDDGSPETVE